MTDPMGSPSYVAQMRRDAAKRVAREKLSATINAAYLTLGGADIAAEEAYLAEMVRINAEACEAYETRKAA